jgi:hypothetical protein
MAADASTTPATSAVARAATTAVSAIRQAAKTTGASFEHLFATAKVESSLNPNLTMKSSTATGLFQFLEQTWLGVLKDMGGALGYGRYAKAIAQTPSGRYVVSDPVLRQEIMAARKDPTANAAMGGAITQQNAAQLRKRIGRQPTDGELYVAHFFGPYAASKVINLASSNPAANAAAMFPRAAGANRPIFNDKQGNARSVAGVYGELVRRYQIARASPTPGVATAAAATAPQSARRAGMDSAAITGALAFAQSAPARNAGATGQDTQESPQGGSMGPVFHSLFQSDDRRGAVAPLVAHLWSTGAAPSDPAASAGTPTVPTAGAPTPAGTSPLDLFRDARPRVRGLFEGNA